MASSLRRKGRKMTMMESYILARKLIKIERKVDEDMDKTRQFIEDHKFELIFAAGVIFAYRLGFKHGYETADNAMTRLINETSKALSITKF